MQLALIGALLAAGATQQAEQGGIEYGPMFVYLKLAPGESARQTFKIRNHSRRAVRLGLSHRDAWHDEEGRRTFPESGSVPRGLGKWLGAPKGERIRIGGGSEIDVDQSVTVPAGVLPGTYLGALMVRLESFEDEAGKEESAASITAGVKVTSAVALLFHVDVKRPDGVLPAPEVSIVGQEVKPPTESTPLSVKLRLLNSSEWEVKPVGTLAVFDAEGRPAGKSSFEPVPVWPGQRLWVAASFATLLKPGKYHALAAFTLQDPGDEQVIYPGQPVKAKVDFEVAPPQSVPPAPRGLEPAQTERKANKQGT